jgi:hypothetical protein
MNNRMTGALERKTGLLVPASDSRTADKADDWKRESFPLGCAQQGPDRWQQRTISTQLYLIIFGMIP